jgi:hypothetical protein
VPQQSPFGPYCSCMRRVQLPYCPSKSIPVAAIPDGRPSLLNAWQQAKIPCWFLCWTFCVCPCPSIRPDGFQRTPGLVCIAETDSELLDPVWHAEHDIGPPYLALIDGKLISVTAARACPKVGPAPPAAAALCAARSRRLGAQRGRLWPPAQLRHAPVPAVAAARHARARQVEAAARRGGRPRRLLQGRGARVRLPAHARRLDRRLSTIAALASHERRPLPIASLN